MMNGSESNTGKGFGASEPSLERADRDLVALGIIVAAIILFVGTGSTVLTGIVRRWFYGVGNPDTLLGNALILNIALLIFGWRRYVELNREIVERRKAELMAQRLAHTDALTGCLNRRSLGETLATLIESAEASCDDVIVMMIDLDKFKRSNDLHGHHVGDAVLIETARRIQALMPERSLMARFGGDEFICCAIFAPGSESAVERLAIQLNDALALPIECNGVRAEVTASIGITCGAKGAVNSTGQLAQDLLHRADVAMYQAKKRGRNRFCWFEPSMETELRFRSELEKSIREGLPRGEFVPYYEKQIDLETGEITGFEMLARWVSARRGVISPEIFIPVAEEIGVISELSESLISLALQDAKAWDPRLTLSVNISPLQLRDPWFAQRLLKLLVEANFPPTRLEIEITETCLHENIGQVRTLITSLKNQGIRISLDDFGTGYSSLAQLRTLPFDRIKIDRSFVSTLGSNADSSSIVEAISSLGRGMALPITAEGIETPEVLDALRKFGKFKGQGYLYGKPVSGEEVLTELAKQQLLNKQSPADQYRSVDGPETPTAING
jgi:diguanylate cyclase (GGDEF)-like protein